MQSVRRPVVIFALAMIAIGACLAIGGSVIEAARGCHPGVLRFDGELNALDWTGRGALVASLGLLALLPALRGSTPPLRWQLSGVIVLALYWSSLPAWHVLSETFRFEIPPSLAGLFIPFYVALYAIKPVIPNSCEQSYYLFFETPLAGFVATALAWWLATALVLHFHKNG